MLRHLNVLIVESSDADAQALTNEIAQAGYEVQFVRVETSDEMAQCVEQRHWHVILSGYRTAEFGALEALAVYRQVGMDIPFIVISDGIGEAAAVEVMRSGAHDCVLKSDLSRLTSAIEHAIHDSETRKHERFMERERLRHAEELRARTDQLERSNKDLERFAYVAAHDLQEPLRMISAYSQLLLRRYSNGLDDDGEEIVNYIRGGIDRMEKLIRGLLTYSRAIHEEEKLLVPVDANEVLENVMHSFAPTVEESGAEIVHADLPEVLADRTQLSHILQNLISNALKYRNHADPPRVEIWAETNGATCTICVRDNGIGIDAQYHERIFDIFRRLHREEYPGIGVGLALVKRFVEQHGGDIWVDSTLGNGATFKFTLPVPPPAEARSA